MKKIRSIIFTFVCLLTLLAANIAPVKAEESEYTYTLTFLAGTQGTFVSNAENFISVDHTGYSVTVTEKKITVSNLKYGWEVRFPDSGSVITLNDGTRYYAKGFRESGLDNTAYGTSATKVTNDEDYVMTYGVKANQVAYTVNFQDEDGAELAPSETYYGNVGDMPVVAYHYIENYVPQAYNLTKTLVEDETQNIFTFVYHTGTTAVNPEPGQGENGNDNGNNNAGNGNGGANADNNAADNQADNAADNAADNQADNADEPEEIVNLDDGNVPLADNSDDTASADNSSTAGSAIIADATVPLGIKIGSGVGIALISAGLIVFIVVTLVKKKKKAPVNK